MGHTHHLIVKMLSGLFLNSTQVRITSNLVQRFPKTGKFHGHRKTVVFRINPFCEHILRAEARCWNLPAAEQHTLRLASCRRAQQSAFAFR
jgi:hypothetical protein